MFPGVVSSQNQMPQFNFPTAKVVETFDENIPNNFYKKHRTHIFSSTTSYELIKGVGFNDNSSNSLGLEFVVVGGGGGGGTPTDRTGGGGGGAGYQSGFYSTALKPLSGTKTVTIGSGGRGTAYPSTNGGTSSLEIDDGFFNASGGGRGGQFAAEADQASVSGNGGGAYHNAADTGGVGEPGFFDGGLGYDSGNVSVGFKAGGGGGGSQDGATASSSDFGEGGLGESFDDLRSFTITLTGGGGGGNQVYSSISRGGFGGGGDGSSSGTSTVFSFAQNGEISTGGGGGGGSESVNDGNINSQGGNGGSGVVYISYLIGESQQPSELFIIKYVSGESPYPLIDGQYPRGTEAAIGNLNLSLGNSIGNDSYKVQSNPDTGEYYDTQFVDNIIAQIESESIIEYMERDLVVLPGF